jgi:hypothetical protein
MGLSTEQSLKLVEKLLKSPYSRDCRHYVAATILDLLEQNGMTLPMELAKAVVYCDDELALIELEKIQGSQE